MDAPVVSAREASAAPTLQDLQVLITAKEHDAEGFQAALAELWVQRQAGTLPREGYPEVMYLEDQLRVTLQQLAALHPQRRYAAAADAMGKARAHHGAYCEPVAAQGLRVCHAWKTFVEECAALVVLIDEQESPLVVLTKPDGQPMYELDGGAQTLQNMLGAVPGQAFLAQTVMPRVAAMLTGQAGALTTGESRLILGHVKGTEPFSDTNVQRYLALYRVEEAKPDVSVEDV